MPTTEDLNKHFKDQAKAAKDAQTTAEAKLRDAQAHYNVNGPERTKMITEETLAELRREAAEAKATAEVWARRQAERERLERLREAKEAKAKGQGG